VTIITLVFSDKDSDGVSLLKSVGYDVSLVFIA
jgi:hypothetical protein